MKEVGIGLATSSLGLAGGGPQAGNMYLVPVRFYQQRKVPWPPARYRRRKKVRGLPLVLIRTNPDPLPTPYFARASTNQPPRRSNGWSVSAMHSPEPLLMGSGRRRTGSATEERHGRVRGALDQSKLSLVNTHKIKKQIDTVFDFTQS
jgi:hypothetical protein